jgi:tetratricopeptide (TPR) repeat protein
MKWSHHIINLAVIGGLTLFLVAPAYANDIATVQTLIKTGDYAAAHDTAVEIQSAEALALAAESLARQVMLGEVKKLKKTSKKARDLAEAALEIDPTHQNARLQYAITDGFVARLTGDVSAWMKKLPQKSFAKIEAYRADFPDDPRGDALLAAWHLGVIRKAGTSNGAKWFDASLQEGQRLYEGAMLASPDDPVIAMNYAFALIALGEDVYSDWNKVKSLLERVKRMPVTDDLSQKIEDHASAALTLLENKKASRDYAEAFLDGEPSG